MQQCGKCKRVKYFEDKPGNPFYLCMLNPQNPQLVQYYTPCQHPQFFKFA